MQVQLECPICEALIAIDDSQAKQVSLVCSECNREFDPRTAEVVPAVAPVDVLIQQPPSLADPVPTQIKNNYAEPSDSGEYQLAKNESFTQSQPRSESVQLRHRSNLKGRRQPLLSAPATIALLALIAIGLLATLPFVLNLTGQLPTKEEQPLAGTPNPVTDGTEVSNSNDPIAMENDKGLNPGKSTPVARKPPKSRSQKINLPTFTMFSTATAKEIWREVQPRVVELEIEKPAGNISAIGTIIDSKGWMVTSYRAVQNASNIHVKQTRPELDHEGELLTDLARGVIAADPNTDLAILEINRRFVVDFSNIEMAEDDYVVAAKRLLQCSNPTEAIPLGVSEVRVRNRRRGTEMSDAEKQGFIQGNLNPDPIDWIQLTDGALIPGAPLVDETGKFLAICTSIGDQELVYAISSSHVFDLMNSSDGRAKPLASIGSAAIPSKPDSVEVDEKMAATAGNPLPPATAQLDRAGAACKLFGFQPKTISHYRDLQELLSQIDEAQKFVSSNKEDPNSPGIMKQVETWKSALKPQTEILAADFNQLAVEAMDTDPTAFAAYVQVHYSAIQSPKFDDKETITFKILGSDRLLVSFFSDQYPVMRPDTKWYIVFGSNEFAELGVDENGENQPTRANLADILWINGELSDD